MNETSINNAIRELEEMTDLLRKISERKITQKQAADKLGITPQAFQTELKNSFSNYTTLQLFHKKISYRTF